MAFCREAYVDGDAVLLHLENVGAQIEPPANFPR